MTLTPKDRETIERARETYDYMPRGSIYREDIGRLLAILDRLADEDTAAPSSPLPDAIPIIEPSTDETTGSSYKVEPPTDKPEQDDAIESRLKMMAMDDHKRNLIAARDSWRADIAASEAKIMAELERRRNES